MSINVVFAGVKVLKQNGTQLLYQYRCIAYLTGTVLLTGNELDNFATPLGPHALFTMYFFTVSDLDDAFVISTHLGSPLCVIS
jgi:hypothetical protein